MGIPPFFNKVVQSAASLLTGFDADRFEQFLKKQRVAIVFDDVQTIESRATTELTVDLLARLYPVIDIIYIGADDGTTAIQRLGDLARQINPAIEIGSSIANDCVIAVVVGNTPAPWSAEDLTAIYAGSDGWVAKISTCRPMNSGNTVNPFGAGAAACIAAANVFRTVFRAQMQYPRLDEDLVLSMLDYSVNADCASDCDLPDIINLEETFLVGVGAIGHGTLWAMRRVHGLRGKLHLIDDENYDETNPQRYIETSADMKKATKVDNRAELMRDRASEELVVVPHTLTWDAYTAERNDWQIDRVALALDSAEDRILVQASLPRRLINSWTQAANIGVSRHDFLHTACVACLYMPGSERPNLDELVAERLGFVGLDEIKFVRKYLDTSEPLDAELLRRIAVSRKLPEDGLIKFEGDTMLSLYQQGVCGGLILRMGGEIGGGDEHVEVPAAFQSALAGIMLAAEIVIDAAAIARSRLPVRTEINLTRPVRSTLSSPEAKHRSGRCICQDQDYIDAFNAKYLD